MILYASSIPTAHDPDNEGVAYASNVNGLVPESRHKRYYISSANDDLDLLTSKSSKRQGGGSGGTYKNT